MNEEGLSLRRFVVIGTTGSGKFTLPQYQHLKVMRFRSPAESDAWLEAQ